MQNSHCNNRTLGLTYLTNLPGPYDLELFSQKLVAEVPDCEKLIGHLGDQNLSKKVQG